MTRETRRWMHRPWVSAALTWCLAGVAAGVGLISQPVSSLAPGVFLDPSWKTGLAFAQVDGLRHGSDILFTYGPLGYLDAPAGLSGWIIVSSAVFRVLALGLFFHAVVTCLCTALPAPWPAVAALVSTAAVGWWSFPGWLMLLGAAVPLLEGLRRAGAPSTRQVLLASAAAPLLFLVKPSLGVILVLVVGAVTVCSRSWRMVLSSGFTMLTGLLVGWGAAGQRFTDLVPWVRTAAELVSGYSEAMMTGGLLGPAVGLVAVSLISLMVLRDRSVGSLPGWAFWIPWTLFVWLLLRTAFVRSDVVHIAPYFVACSVLALVGARSGRPLVLRLVASALSIAAAAAVWPGGVVPDPRNWRATAEFLLSNEQRDVVRSRARDLARAHYAASPGVLEALGGRRVTVDQAEVTFAWAYDLEWAPVPVFQSYVAYTPTLDRRNARSLLGDEELRVLRERATIDQRQQLWDGPAFSTTLACHFELEAEDAHWAVFRRVGDRCGESRPEGENEVAAGVKLEIPQPGEGRAVSMSFEPSGQGVPGTVAGAIFRPPRALWVELDDEAYRLPVALAGGPSLVSVPDSLAWEDGLLDDATSISFSQPGTVRFTSFVVD